MQLRPPKTRPGGPGVALSDLLQVKHRRDFHSSGPCMTPKMKEQLQERGHEGNAKGVCFRAGRTGAGRNCPSFSTLDAKLEFQPASSFLNLHSRPLDARDQWDTPRGAGNRNPKTGHARSASQFSENFLSSLQGRAESRLTEARFSQGRGRPGQVPGSAGFLAGCLSPPGGRAFIFSTPRAQNLGACPAGARVSGLSPAAKSGGGGPRVRASRGSPWSGQKTTDSGPLKPDGSAARPSPPKTYRLTSAWLPPSCAALSLLGNRVPRWPSAASPTPEELHLPQGTWLPLPRPIGSDVFAHALPSLQETVALLREETGIDSGRESG